MKMFYIALFIIVFFVGILIGREAQAQANCWACQQQELMLQQQFRQQQQYNQMRQQMQQRQMMRALIEPQKQIGGTGLRPLWPEPDYSSYE